MQSLGASLEQVASKSLLAVRGQRVIALDRTVLSAARLVILLATRSTEAFGAGEVRARLATHFAIGVRTTTCRLLIGIPMLEPALKALVSGDDVLF